MTETSAVAITDLSERAPADSLLEKFVSFRGTRDVRELPLGVVWISRDARRWWRGVHGELEMAARLARLSDEWSVLHSIPVGDGRRDIDHLVVGPAGVFPINTKRLVDRRVRVSGGTFLVDGQARDYLRSSATEARRVEMVLRRRGIYAPILPVVAISAAKSVRVSRPRWNGLNIGVARVERIVQRMTRRTTRLSPEEVAQIVEVFIDPSVWTWKTPADPVSDEVRAAFEVLDRGVRRWNTMIATIAIVAGTPFFLAGIVIFLAGVVLAAR